MSDFKDPHLAGLMPRVESINGTVQAAVEGIGAEDLIWRPDSKAWSVGLCLEHLIVTFDEYHPRIRDALDRAAERGKPRKLRKRKPSFVGKRLIPAMRDSNRRLRAPRVFVPGPAVRAGALSEFLSRQELLADFMREADGYDLTRARISSPVSRFLRLNLGDCFEILVTHAERHVLQIQNVRAQLGNRG